MRWIFTKLAPEKYRSLDPWSLVQHATTGPWLPQHLITTSNLYHYILSYSPISHCKTAIFHKTCPREVSIAQPLTLSPACYHRTMAAPTLNYNEIYITIYSHTRWLAIVKQQFFMKLAPEKYRLLDPRPLVQQATTGPQLPQHLITTWNLYHYIFSYCQIHPPL